MTAHKLLKSAVDLELLPRNPADNSEVRNARPRPKAKPPTIWTAEQTKAFLDSQRGPPVALWRLAVTTGLRRGELCGLRWQDIDLDPAAQRHHDGVVVKYKVIASQPKTDKSRRAVDWTSPPSSLCANTRHGRRPSTSRRGLHGPTQTTSLSTSWASRTTPARHADARSEGEGCWPTGGEASLASPRVCDARSGGRGAHDRRFRAPRPLLIAITSTCTATLPRLSTSGSSPSRGRHRRHWLARRGRWVDLCSTVLARPSFSPTVGARNPL